ncbi:MAG: hypothetical protein KDD82_25815 [Planctomycetes bacterium]|nr:hypothetical protein [Planctomycetota bacterium]
MLIDLDVTDMPLAKVMDVIERQVQVNIIVDPNIDVTVTERFRSINWRLAVDLIAKTYNCEVEEIEGALYIKQPPKVTLTFTDANIRTVLQLIAQYAGKNIIIAPEITGKITVDLHEVHWLDALEAIVETSGPFAVVKVGDDDLLRIVTRDSIKQELETVVLPLKFSRPPAIYNAVPPKQVGNNANSSAAVFVGQRPTQAVTDVRTTFTLFRALQEIVKNADIAGAYLDYDLQSNAFVVTATPPLLAQLRDIIAKVDREPDQIFCEVRFVATRDNDFEQTGIEFSSGSEFDGLRMAGPFRDDSGTKRQIEQFRADPTAPGTVERFTTLSGEYPFLLGERSLSSQNGFIPALLDYSGLNMTLNMIHRDDRSKIVQSPSLFMQDNTDAVIFVGENVPYAQLQSQPDANGNVIQTLTEGDESPVAIGFSLFLQPHVIPNDNRVVMTVIPRVNALIGTTSPIAGFELFGFGDLQINLPRTREQALVSQIMLRDTQTAVLGGLRTRNQGLVIKAVPILSSIPIIGNLFKSTTTTNSVENLTVFISPTIVRQASTVNSIFLRASKRVEQDDWFYKNQDAPTEDEKIDALEEEDGK